MLDYYFVMLNEVKSGGFAEGNHLDFRSFASLRMTAYIEHMS